MVMSRVLATALSILVLLFGPAHEAAAAPPGPPGSQEFHAQLWPAAFGSPYVHGQSSITLGNEVAPGVREVLLFDYASWSATGTMLHVGFFTNDATYTVSWLGPEQHQLDTSGAPVEVLGTIFSNFTAVSGRLDTTTGFSSHLSALVDSTSVSLNAPAEAAGTYGLTTLAPRALFTTAEQARTDAARFASEVGNLIGGGGGQDGCAADCASAYNLCLSLAKIARDTALANCSYWNGSALGGCTAGAAICSPGGFVPALKCCAVGGIIGGIIGKAQCRQQAHNAYAGAVAGCKATFIACMAACGITIDEM